MRKGIVFLCLIVFATGCGSGLPRNVLPKDKMEKVLWDVAQGGEFLNGFVIYKDPGQNRAAVSNKILDEILMLDNVSKKELDASIKYYKDHPKALGEILDSIGTKQIRTKEEAEKAKAKADSIKNRQDSLLHKKDSVKTAPVSKTMPVISKPATVDSLKAKDIEKQKKISPKKKKKKHTKKRSAVK